nr:IS30 family transposase [Fluviibacter phosphoraccumulans]
MGRPGLSDQEKSELWRRWQAGQTLTDIGLALGKHAGSVHGVISLKGGIAPTARTRASKHLTLHEREQISRGLAKSMSLRSIARDLGRSPSTISREVSKNQGVIKYRAVIADELAWERSRRPKSCFLASRPTLCQIVASKLEMKWSPEQISGWLKHEFPGKPDMQISHETIYRSLFIQARGVLKKELVAHLRSRRMMRRSKLSTTKGQPRGQIIDAVSIRERPAEVADRAVPGHWEGDLLTGSHNSHIATLVERHSRFTILVQVGGKDTNSVITALTREVNKIPASLKKTLTWDRGSEMAQHKSFTVATDVQVYFCDPRSPWQRGSNENTNRLLRQYFPKGTDLKEFNQEYLDQVALQLNERPRKTLGFDTPAARLSAYVASTG